MTSTTRGSWGNRTEFILTCIGFAVGLGNLWRFPATAYEHGGSAFLIPYVCCSIFLGLPCLYLEFLVGQLTQHGAAKAYRHYMPALQGIGWAATIAAFCIGTYYNVIITWCLLYMWDVVTGKSHTWTTCDNEWNTEMCLITNGSGVQSKQSIENILPAEEYFNNELLRQSSGLTEIGSLNWHILIALLIVWTITALCMTKGVALIGKISYITATLPYVIISILFVRGVTLDGAEIGLNYYLFEPDFNKLTDATTWIAAANQLCFSLALGFGALLSLSSYNSHTHNCFRDAVIVIVSDSVMAVFGGCAVFSTLGFLSKQTGRPIENLIASGTTLAFVAYPEAISRMPIPWFFSFLLFTMFFLLGISSQFGLTQNFVTAIVDEFKGLRSKQWMVAIAACLLSFTLGLSMCWQNGFHWFNVLNNSVGGNTVFIVILLELLLTVHFYGVRNVAKDIRGVFGEPSSVVGKVIGPTGYLFFICWLFISPLILIALLVFSVRKQIMNEHESAWLNAVSVCIMYIPLLAIPIFVVVNASQYKKYNRPLMEIFRTQRTPLDDNKVYPTDPSTKEMSKFESQQEVA